MFEDENVYVKCVARGEKTNSLGKSYSRASPIAQQVKNPPTMQETQKTWVQSLGWEDPLEKEMATHSSTLARKIPRIEETGGLQSMGLQRVGHD